MNLMLIGFDSAWTATNTGAIVAVVRSRDGTFQELGLPLTVNYLRAENQIHQWQSEVTPTATMVLLDQPTIVENSAGQRPVEKIVSCVISRRYGGMQPAYTAKKQMFGMGAPIWQFLGKFAGPTDFLEPISDTQCLRRTLRFR